MYRGHGHRPPPYGATERVGIGHLHAAGRLRTRIRLHSSYGDTAIDGQAWGPVAIGVAYLREGRRAQMAFTHEGRFHEAQVLEDQDTSRRNGTHASHVCFPSAKLGSGSAFLDTATSNINVQYAIADVPPCSAVVPVSRRTHLNLCSNEWHDGANTSTERSRCLGGMWRYCRVGDGGQATLHA